VSSLLWKVIQTCYPRSSKILTATSDRKELTALAKLRFFTRVLQCQVSGSCDELFFDHLGLARTQGFVPAFRRRRYGVFLHSIEAWRPLKGNHLKVLKEATIRVANSHYTAARIAAANPDVGVIDVCHLALDPDGFQSNPPSTRPLESCEDQIVAQIRRNSVLIVGRMLRSERHKGHEQLIRAWPLVQQGVPGAQLVIVGQGDDVPRLMQIAVEVGVRGDTLFAGRVSDRALDVIYDRVAVFAMPSRGEGFGIVYLEAMRHRLPCIGTVHDAAREIIVDGETGYLVDQGDIANLSGKIERLLADPALRRRLGSSGFNRLQMYFSFDGFQARISAALARLSSSALGARIS
jgi:phosphatidyl-myo-inositol dimannoside synthase